MHLYSEIEYAKTRLIGSLVRKGDDPIIVNNISRGSVSYTDVASWEDGLLCKYKELNIDPVPLGYCHVDGEAVYVRRIPARKYKQGLSDGTMTSNSGMPISFQSLIHCIKGIYPALKPLSSGSLAFSRDYARDYKDNLFYKGNWKVGHLTWDGVHDLLPEFVFLREHLLETLEESYANS